MSGAKVDTRPHGSVELQATIYGSWSKALFMAQAGALAGHRVTIEDGQHKSLKGLPLQTIKVGS